MMRSIISKLLFIVIGIGVASCIKPNEENLTEHSFDTKIDIKSINPVSGNPNEYIEKYHGILKTQGLEPNFSASQVVTYTNVDVAAIFTPLQHTLKASDNNSMLIFFESNDQLLDFDLIITETILDDEITRYKYSTITGEFIVQFDVQLENGIVIGVITSKSWGNRWRNCVEWTLNQMTHIDYLACMAVGKYCAGGIAALCAVNASEGLFETPNSP